MVSGNDANVPYVVQNYVNASKKGNWANIVDDEKNIIMSRMGTMLMFSLIKIEGIKLKRRNYKPSIWL